MDVYIKALSNPDTKKEVRNLFNRNVKSKFPAVALTPANKVTSETVAVVLRSIVGEGKRTTARKLRSYLRSAFENARSVQNDPTISKDYIPFHVQNNPVVDVQSIANAAGVDKTL